MPHSATSSTPISDVFAPGHLGDLTRIISPDLVDAALDTVGGKEQRLRRLPSRVVVYLLLAGTLFAGEGWLRVWTHLTSGVLAPPTRPSKSSITEAMRRVGTKPLRELFTLLQGPGVTRTGEHVTFAGRLVLAIDGTQIPVADTEMNQTRFPKHSSGPNGEAGYPMIRLVTIIATGTRHLIEAVFGDDRTSELAYADRLNHALTPGTLLLADRGFAAHRFYTLVHNTGADFLIRAKHGRTAKKLPVLQVLADGTALSRVGEIMVRVITANLTLTTVNGPRTSTYRFVTTLLDPTEAPAHALVTLYHERWEIETAYCELKSTMLGGRVLRGRYPAAVEQETWAILATYQALRIAITDAVLEGPGIDPDRASFTLALHTAREQVIHLVGAQSVVVTDLAGQIGACVLADPLPARRYRTRQRVVKRAISKHRGKGPGIDRRTYPATLRTQILASDPEP